MSALTPAKLAAATTQFSTLFREALATTETKFQKVATEIPSGTREMAHAWLDRLPQMREWIGERKVNNAAVRLQSVVNKKYEDTVEVDRDNIDDDMIGVYEPIFREFGQAAKNLPDIAVASVMQGGTSAVVYDNQHFFDTAHPVNMDDSSVTGAAGAATQANLLTSHALSADNLADAIQIMRSFFGSDGTPLDIEPDMLVVPPQLDILARRLLQGTLIGRSVTLAGPTYGAAADTNILQGALDLFCWNRLASDATSWYVLCTKRAVKPFIWQNREAPEFVALVRPDDPEVFKRNKFQYGVRARGAGAYGPYFLALKCTA